MLPANDETQQVTQRQWDGPLEAGGVDDYTDDEPGYRREVNMIRKTWRWAKGSGEFRNFKTGDSFNTLTKDRQEAAIENGKLYKQRKAEAAQKRATLNR